MEKIYGYARISRRSQNIERQIRNILAAYPDARIFQEAYTGTKIVGRTEFNKMLRIVKPVASTILPSIVGAMFGIYNSTLFDMFELKLNTLLLVKAILLVISLFVLIMFVAPKNKNKKLINEIKTEKEVDSKKKTPRKKVTKWFH